MRKRLVDSRKTRATKSKSRKLATQLEQLEPRLVLAPMLDPSLTGLFTEPRELVPLSDDAFGVDSNGNGAIEVGERATSLRIEAAPRVPGFEGDLFAIARGPYEDTNNDGVLDPGEDVNFNGALDCIAGRMFRINPNSGEVTLFNPTTAAPECIPTGTPGGRVVPGGGDLGFGGYTNFFDIAIDPVGIFDGQPAIYVTTVDDSPVLPGVGAVRNAIYRFSPSGAPLDFFDGNGNGIHDAGDGAPIPFAMFVQDVNFDGTPDDAPAVIAFTPASAAEFTTGLYVGDVDVDAPGDGNDLFVITAGVALSPITPGALTRMVIGSEDLNANGLLDPGEDLNGNGALNLSSPSGVIVNEDTEERVMPPATGGVPDLDLRGVAFGRELVPTIPTGRTGDEDALYGVSTDLEDDMPVGAISLRFLTPSNSLAVNDFAGGSEPLSVHHWGDVAVDPVGFFRLSATTPGGALGFQSRVFQTDHHASLSPLPGGAVYRVQAGFNDADPFLVGFDVPESDLAINPTGGMEEAFSVTMTPDGRRLFVSDLTAVYLVDPLGTLERSEVGQLIGLSDLRDLDVPYRGAGLAAAIIDTGVDSSHGGFGGHATDGVNIVIPGAPGTFDFVGHGTAVGGIVSQMVPDATIVPVQLFTSAAGFSQQGTWEAIKYVADNPTVVDPVTGLVSRIVGVTMSFGTITPTETVGNFTSEIDAFQSHQSLVTSLKFQFRRYLKLGITAVGAAGNEGFLSPVGMKASIIPAVLREVVEAIATYAYPFDLSQSNSPLDRAQGVAIGLPLDTPAGCLIFPGDAEVYVDKVISFSSRSPFSDFGAPGECVRTFAPTLFTQFGFPAIEPAFNGTSAATPVHVGQVVLAHSAVGYWARVFAAGGATTDTYLTRPADVVSLSLEGIRNLRPYATADGVNSILHWTAIPILDLDFPGTGIGGASLDNDIVDQLPVRTRSIFRTYARTDIGNAVAAIEGAVAMDYLTAGTKRRAISPRVLALDMNCNGAVTAAEIEAFIDDLPRGPGCPLPPGVPAGDIPEIKAMARLLGGTDIDARIRRMQFFDLAADGSLPVPSMPSLTLAQFNTLKSTLLPSPKAFRITARNSKGGFLLAPDRHRYEDLGVSRTGLFVRASSRKGPASQTGDPVAPLVVPPASRSGDQGPAAPASSFGGATDPSQPTLPGGGWVAPPGGATRPNAPLRGSSSLVLPAESRATAANATVTDAALDSTGPEQSLVREAVTSNLLTRVLRRIGRA